MLPNPNLQRVVRQAIYQLKQTYGAPVDVYKMDTSSTDYRTGTRTTSVSKVYVRHAVVLPADAIKRNFQGITYISESKPFVSQGGPGWDEDMRGFIIDGRDMPGYQWELEDWIIYDQKQYEVHTINELEHQTGWFIIGKRIRGSVAAQIHEVAAGNDLSVEQDANGEVE